MPIGLPSREERYRRYLVFGSRPQSQPSARRRGYVCRLERLDHADNVRVGQSEPSRRLSFDGHPEVFVESSGSAVLRRNVECEAPRPSGSCGVLERLDEKGSDTGTPMRRIDSEGPDVEVAIGYRIDEPQHAPRDS